MCGIIGYSGSENAVPILLHGLRALEYRGYDSSGISIFNGSEIVTVKSKGRIEENEKKTVGLEGNCGIGHTRWATHGEPSDINSHPHTSDNISLVHNGIIENYAELKADLISKGYTFKSETDTEAAVILLEDIYKTTKDPISAIRLAISRLCGSFAFGIMFRDYPGKIFATRKDSPLIASFDEHGSFIASDIPAILKYSTVYYEINDEIVILDGKNVTLIGCKNEEVIKQPIKTNLTYEQATKSGFPHYMLKEIYDEPLAIKNTLSGRIKDGLADFDIPDAVISKINEGGRIHIVGCGTAMHAGLIGKHFIEKNARIPVICEIASEFRYKNPILSKEDIFIAVSQSGETADTLAALRLAKDQGLFIISIVNVQGSSIARESDLVINTYAGTEIAVASTKAYTVQVAILYLLSVYLGKKNSKLETALAKSMAESLLNSAPKAIEKVFESKSEIEAICDTYIGCENLFFMGRGIDGILSQEASLKLKEISYIHSEAYAAGELKHGTISLITEGTRVIAIITDDVLLPKMLSNIKEVKTRGAHVTVICDENLCIPSEAYDKIITVPHIECDLTPLSCASAFQLIAYYTATKRGCDVDKPRNLAKSVTVE